MEWKERLRRHIGFMGISEPKSRAARERKRYSDVVVEALEKHLGMKPRDKKKK
jgi:hypothetical protein